MTAPHRTRIKICGLTREADVDAAVQAGADAIGFVLYPKSPRFVSAQRAAELSKRLPAFVTPVLLFVNEATPKVITSLSINKSAVAQFHGDEDAEACSATGHRHIRAARIPTAPGAPGFDLLEYVDRYPLAQAILLDALVDGFGGGGKTFDWTAFNWSQLPPSVSSRLVLSGGLDAANVIDGILTVRPWAVDVSSGVELTGIDGKPVKGTKDPNKMAQFVAAVRAADAQLNTLR
jgi:phosphoribosylanthranilate isomerase